MFTVEERATECERVCSSSQKRIPPSRPAAAIVVD